MPTLAPKLPYTHPFAGGYPRVGGQPLPTDPDAIDYLARVAAADGAAVEVGVAMAVDQFIKGCKADGIWDAIKASCIMCGARTISGALVPLVGAAPTPYNFASGDYDRSGGGLKGDGSTKYLDSNRADDADSQDDRHLAVYVTSATTTNRHFIGNFVASPVFSMSAVYWGVTSNIRSLVSGNSTLQTVGTYAGTDGTFAGAVRTGSTAAELRAISETVTDNVASTGTNTINNYVFARNDSNTANVYSDARLAFYSIGSALDLAALDTRVTQLITGIKFHSLTGLVATDYDPDTVAYIVAAYEAGGTL